MFVLCCIARLYEERDFVNLHMEKVILSHSLTSIYYKLENGAIKGI